MYPEPKRISGLTWYHELSKIDIIGYVWLFTRCSILPWNTHTHALTSNQIDFNIIWHWENWQLNLSVSDGNPINSYYRVWWLGYPCHTNTLTLIPFSMLLNRTVNVEQASSNLQQSTGSIVVRILCVTSNRFCLTQRYRIVSRTRYDKGKFNFLAVKLHLDTFLFRVVLFGSHLYPS